MTSTGTDIDPGSPRLDGLDRARTIADAVLYEGYLLYPCLLYTSDAADE